MISIKSVFIAMMMVLVGCGGDSSSSDATTIPQPPPKPESKLLALDGFSTVKPGTKTRVNLSPFVRGDNVQIVSASLEGSDTHCGIPIIDGTNLDITAGNGAYCSYSYLAQSGDIQSYAQLRVLATDADVPMLPPVSQAMVLGSSNLSLNLETLLGSDWPAGYQLNSSSVNVQGNEGNLGSIVSVTANTIVYKSPELSGWNRLVYTISNLAKPGEDKMGVVYITVSEEVNQPPIIGVPKYQFQFAPKEFDKKITATDALCSVIENCPASNAIAVMGDSVNVFWLNEDGDHIRNITLPVGEEYNGRTVTIQHDPLNRLAVWNDRDGGFVNTVHNLGGRVVFKNYRGNWYSQNSFTEGSAPGFVPNDTIYAGDTVTLDLSQLHGIDIKEPDGQEWQLIDVQSYSATVTPTNPNSVTNKSFNFNAGTVGEHYVSYIIADHFGGYSSGLIKITVSAKENPVTWNSISSNGNVFTAPLIYSQALDKGLNVSAQWDNGVNNTVAGFGQNTGTLYCDTIGVLPSVNELGSLRNDSSSTTKLNLWPKQKAYLAQNNGTVVGYNLRTGSTQAYNASVPYYVTCIENKNLSLQMLTYTVVANNTRVPVAKVNQPNASSTITLSKVEGTLSEGDVALLQDKLSDTVENITTQSTKAGTYRFQVTDTADTTSTLTSSKITYVADKDTVTISDFNGLRVITNNAVAGTGANVVEAQVKDYYGNPVSNTYVRLEVQGVVAQTLNGKTDALGKVQFYIKSSRIGSATAMAIVEGTTVQTSSNTVILQFSNPTPRPTYAPDHSTYWHVPGRVVQTYYRYSSSIAGDPNDTVNPHYIGLCRDSGGNALIFENALNSSQLYCVQGATTYETIYLQSWFTTRSAIYYLNR